MGSLLLVIVHQGIRRGAMKDKTCSILDFFLSIRVIGKMIGEFELKGMFQSSGGKPHMNAWLCSVGDMQFFTIRNIVMAMNSL